MDIKTKFNIGDKVVIIECCSKEVFENCTTCNGTKEIIVKDKIFDCPDCHGYGGETKWLPVEWRIINDDGILSGYDKIIKIEVEVTKKETNIKYMLGHRYSQSSLGNYWFEDCVFSTIEEAQAECIKRNKEIEKSA